MNCPSCQSVTGTNALSCPACDEPLPVEAGTRIDGRYEVLERLGQGGMGTVFKARDLDLKQLVAVKVARLDRSPQAGERFRSEIRLARRIKHQNVCSLWANGYEGKVAYVVMELVEGKNLRELLRERGLLPWVEACDLALQAAQGLQAIHEAGVIHRDLKAANLMIDAQNVVRLVDFGIAKASLKDVEKDQQADSSITDTGQVVGSVEYMSPEQVRALPLDARSDIYSFGIVLFELFTGRVPFHGDSPMTTMLKQLETAPPLDGPTIALVPPNLVPILRRALAKDPADRYPTARVLLADLRRLRASLVDQTTDSLAGPAPGARGFRFWLPILLAATFGVYLLLLGPSIKAPTTPGPSPTPATPTATATPSPPSSTLLPPPPERPQSLRHGPVTTTASPTTTTPPPTPTTTVPLVAVTLPPMTTISVTLPVTTTTTLPTTATVPLQPGQLYSRDDPEVVRPVCKDCPTPYSPIAERLGLQGDVVLDILVDENGQVVDAVATRGDDVLKDIAQKAVKKWRYKPATKSGVAGKVHITITLRFQLQRPH